LSLFLISDVLEVKCTTLRVSSVSKYNNNQLSMLSDFPEPSQTTTSQSITLSSPTTSTATSTKMAQLSSATAGKSILFGKCTEQAQLITLQ